MLLIIICRFFVSALNNGIQFVNLLFGNIHLYNWFCFYKWDAKIAYFIECNKFLRYWGLNYSPLVLSSFKNEKRIDWSKESSKLNSRAHQNPVTVNPSIKWSASNMIAALMTSRNKPKVTMVMGKVSMTMMGLTRKFKRLSTRATTMAVV